MKKELLLPNYNHSNLNLINSILNYFNVETKYNGIKDIDNILKRNYQNIVLVVLDGMGSNILNIHSPNGFFSKHKIDNITTIYPSTTAAAMNMYYSGKPPIESGYIAFTQYFKEYNRTIEMLSRNDAYTGEKIDYSKYNIFENDLNYDSVYSKIQKFSQDTNVYEIKPNHCDKHTSKCIHIENIDDICDSIISLCTNNEKKYIFAYFDSPDKILHRNGCSSKIVGDFISNTENKFKEMYKKLQGTNSLIIISADHGHTDINETINILDLPELLDCLYMPPTFEHRLISFNVKADKISIFKDLFTKRFKDSFILYSKKEFLESGLLGLRNPKQKNR